MKRLSVTAVISMINRMQVQEERVDTDATPAIFEAANKFRSRDSDNSVFGNSSTFLFLCKSAVGQNVYKYLPQGRQKSSGENWLEEQNMYSYLTQGVQQTLVNMQPRNMAFMEGTQQQSRKDGGVPVSYVPRRAKRRVQEVASEH